MAEISASLVMELRQKTGAKMMDAKRALVDADGNFDKAVELLREKGQADAAKRTHRTTAEGIVVTAQSDDHSSAVLVELNCETDFVAKTDQFLALAKSLVDYVLSQPAGEITGDNLPEAKQDEIKAAIAKTGENIQMRRAVKISAEAGVVETYIHLGGKIGVLVHAEGKADETARDLARDLAMQVAAASPDYLTRTHVPAEKIASEMEIYRNLGRNEGKKEEFLDRIAEGRLEKFFKENCLVEQSFIKDPDTSVKDLVAKTCSGLEIKYYIRYQLGQ